MNEIALKRMNLTDEQARILQKQAGSNEVMEAVMYNDCVCRVMNKCEKLDMILQKTGIKPGALEASKQVIKLVNVRPISELMEAALQMEDFLDYVLVGYEHEMKKGKKSLNQRIKESI
jgi:hypothetical protein